MRFGRCAIAFTAAASASVATTIVELGSPVFPMPLSVCSWILGRALVTGASAWILAGATNLRSFAVRFVGASACIAAFSVLRAGLMLDRGSATRLLGEFLDVLPPAALGAAFALALGRRAPG